MEKEERRGKGRERERGGRHEWIQHSLTSSPNKVSYIILHQAQQTITALPKYTRYQVSNLTAQAMPWQQPASTDTHSSDYCPTKDFCNDFSFQTFILMHVTNLHTDAYMTMRQMYTYSVKVALFSLTSVQHIYMYILVLLHMQQQSFTAGMYVCTLRMSADTQSRMAIMQRMTFSSILYFNTSQRNQETE